MIIGIDPGLTGGMAALSDDGDWVGGVRMPIIVHGKRKMVDTDRLWGWLAEVEGRRETKWPAPKVRIAVEAPNSMPRQGLQSTYNFGRHCGAVEGWAISTGYPVSLVTPSTWKKKLGLTSDKRASLDRARLEFGANPLWEVLANDGIAEAALVALWCRNQS